MNHKVIRCISSVLLATTVIAGFSACTTGQATRTSSTIYEPTNSQSVQILFEKPDRPYEVIGQVGSRGSLIASDDGMYRAMQKEAAELGAHAVLIQGDGVKHEHNYWDGGYQRARGLAIRWKDGSSHGQTYSTTPTNLNPTTPSAEQIIPRGSGVR